MKAGSPNVRRLAALWLLAFTIVAWPISALTIFRSEPQGILGLSWLAISITALDIVLTSDVRAEQDDNS